MCSVPTSTPYYIYARVRRDSGRKPYVGGDAKVLRKLKNYPPRPLKLLNSVIFPEIRRRKTHSAGGRTGTEPSEKEEKNENTG